MPKVNLDSRLVRRREVVATDVGGELVLMNADLGEYYGFDPIATRIWRRLAEPASVADLIGELTAEYDGDPQIIAADVRALLDRLAEKALVSLEG